jgi:hypothetical protein
LTAEQIEALVEQLGWAARYYASFNPAAARRFDQAALMAGVLTEQIRRQDELSRIRVELAAVKAAISERFGHEVDQAEPAYNRSHSTT